MRRAPIWILTALAVLAAAPAHAGADVPLALRACGLKRHLGPDLADRLARAPRLTPAAAGAKGTRDAFGTFPNMRESANFVVKWGPNGSFTDEQLDLMLGGFEDGWAKLIGEMSHTPPTGTGTYLFNVYIGNTGGPSPDISGAAGYTYIDNDGYPYIVIAPEIVDYYNTEDYAAYGDHTMVHEFFHAVQFSTGAYDLSSDYDAYFWWESTAEWAAAVTYPSSPYNYAFVGAYAMLPHLPLHYVDYPDEGTLIELHHYGAGIFAQYITEIAADEWVIRDSWENAGPNDDPLQLVDGLLGAHGTSLRAIFADYTAHNVQWDYQQGAIFRSNTEYFVSAYPGEDDRIAAEIPGEGIEELQDVPYDLAPKRFGYSVVRLRNPAEGNLTLSLEVDPNDAGDVAAVAVRSVLGSVGYVALTPADGAPERLEAALPDLTSSETVELVVTNQSASLLSPPLPFRYAARIQAPGEKGDDAPAGCACSLGAVPGAGQNGAALLWVLGAAAALLARRRRRV